MATGATTGLRTDEEVALGLSVLFLVSFLAAYLVDVPELWLLWAVAMAVASGLALLYYNR